MYKLFSLTNTCSPVPIGEYETIAELKAVYDVISEDHPVAIGVEKDGELLMLEYEDHDFFFRYPLLY